MYARRDESGGGNHERELGSPLAEINTHVAHLSELSSHQGIELERGVSSITSIGKKNQNHSNETNLFTHSPIHLFTSKKVAFTLAEVLITLGIIGVVAALTMPVLISNVQDRVKQKRVENIKQKLSKVTDKMAVQSGLIGYGDTMSFVQEMSKHMKLAKICDNNHISDCWPTEEVTLNDEGKIWEISKTKNAKALKMSQNLQNNWADTVGIVTADGTSMILSYKKDCDFDIDKLGLKMDKSSSMSNSTKCLSGIFDWNGAKNPNKLDDDILRIGMATGLGDECATKVNGRCTTPAFTPEPITRAECEESKSKLGISSCGYEQDYWAGAVKQCGGVQNLMTADELAKFASLLYKGNPIINSTKDTGLITLNMSVATSMGFIDLPFSILSGEERSNGGVYRRDFYLGMTGWYLTSREDNRLNQTICLSE